MCLASYSVFLKLKPLKMFTRIGNDNYLIFKVKVRGYNILVLNENNWKKILKSSVVILLRSMMDSLCNIIAFSLGNF